MRTDGKELLPQHVETLCAFCQCAGPFVNHLEDDEISRANLRTKIVCKEGFMQFWKDFVAKRVESGEKTWKDLKSPYDM